MWRETNFFGIYMSPLVVYVFVTAVIYAPLRYLAVRFGAFRWTWHPPLTEAALFVCILGLLVGFL